MNEPRLRTVLLVVAVYHLLLGAFMFFAPGAFYDSLGKFPPKNPHYIKDTATFYIAFGFGAFVAVRRRSGNPNGSVMGSRAYLVARIVCGCSAVAMSILSQ